MRVGDCEIPACVRPAPEEVHVSSTLLLQAEREVLGRRGEQLFMLSGTIRDRAAHVLGLHPIRAGVHSDRDGVQATDTTAANRDLQRQRAGRTDRHIGSAHSHLPHHRQGPSPQDVQNMRSHAGEESGQVHLILHDRGNGTMGFQARNGFGERVRVLVHDAQTGRVFEDAPDSPHWRLESNGRFRGSARGSPAIAV